MPIIKCDQCGKEFDRITSQINKYKNHFCSRKCKYKFEEKPNEIIFKDSHAEIILKSKTHGDKITLIDLEDIEKIKNYTWYPHFDKSINNFYAVTTGNKNKKMHRIIMNCPEGLVIDHKHHNTLDNRKQNLKICTQQKNAENRNGANFNNKSSGHRNVYWFKNEQKWHVSLCKNYKTFRAGYFTRLEDAIKAARNLRLEHYGIV